jgi:hypothetical protein
VIDDNNTDTVSKISDVDSRISSLESQMGDFHKGILDLKRYPKQEAQKQSKTLSQILALLCQDNAGDTPSNVRSPIPSVQTNPLDQMSLASGSSGSAGSGS